MSREEYSSFIHPTEMHTHRISKNPQASIDSSMFGQSSMQARKLSSQYVERTFDDYNSVAHRKTRLKSSSPNAQSLDNLSRKQSKSTIVSNRIVERQPKRFKSRDPRKLRTIDQPRDLKMKISRVESIEQLLGKPKQDLLSSISATSHQK